MRIIAGRHKGHKLFGPKDKSIRPTSDRVKENLYNILSAIDSDFFAAKIVLDLFAGSGALGLEALSRGAARCVFVDKASEALEILKNNIAKLGVEKQSSVLQANINNLSLLAQQGYVFDIVFADPPYGYDFGRVVLQQLSAHKLLSEDAFFILEEASNVALPEAVAEFSLLQYRNYGAASLAIYKRQLI
ncbi:16S rRNA (guanine(966)-N(2))-methyltransferase RsmD [Bartonella sp. TP]|uniref:16S rRNA (guanine(966)-N(2))-methyltransferase RsmD n=1 Tax=Bartonella sp. TP TaxID=3057550 RepID=UPI0025B19DA5|nr:16S rRNA (guanine(966)-N(2))-methyltransferase RsmD [Bartonella sp. TP]MDN5249240.1 16S rRNA (guanine(966)-N(2))-methyltransferase RsmD [Alphaproteobacteria bacterium]WJW80353.1 16S rRNA (guanine(966)-N(2))-methyltransferase RsmD [Bartonella sp. TP]